MRNAFPHAPLIRTPLPGPRAKKIMRLERRYGAKCHARAVPLVVKRARGCVIEDVDGNRFLDFAAGVAVNAAGHCPPAVTRAVRAQALQFLHVCGSIFYNEAQIRLAEKLCRIAPGPSPKRVFFANSGAEAVEAALKLARYHTRRSHVLAFQGAFHGRTLGAVSLSGSKTAQRAHFGPLVPDIHHVPYAYCYRCPCHLTFPGCEWACVREIEKTLFKTIVAPEEVAAIFVEPIQGESGYVVPPDGFLKLLREIADRYGILLVVDEIQTGFGRTGRMFAVEHAGVEPDILCLAKGIASGMPLSAIVAKEKVMDWPAGTHGTTFGGNPVCCRAALASIELIERVYLKKVASKGAYLLARLAQLRKKYPERIGDVRGLGLMLGVELISDAKSRSPDRKLRDALVGEVFRKGLVLLACGEAVLRFCPPLCVTHSEMDVALELLEAAVAKLAID